MTDPIKIDSSGVAPFAPSDLLTGEAAVPQAGPSAEPGASPAAAPATDSPPVDPPMPDIPKSSATEADRDEFMRHILGSGHFSKVYTAAGGGLRCTLRTRSVLENDEVYDMLSRMIAAGRLSSNAAGAEYLIHMFRLFLAASLSDLVISGRAIAIPTGSVEKRHDALRAALNETQFRVLLRFQEAFETLVSELYKEGVQSDFMFGRTHGS